MQSRRLLTRPPSEIDTFIEALIMHTDTTPSTTPSIAPASAPAAESPYTIPLGTVLAGTVRVEAPFRTWPCTLIEFTGGAFSYVSPDCRLYRVTLGRYCSIGDGVSILSQHPTDRLTSSPVLYQSLFAAPFNGPATPLFDSLADTVIGNDVWIGASVQIKTGVRIGDGAVIGAGSVVSKDVAPFMVVAGVPARVIRARFPASTIQRIQALAWWRFNILPLGLSANIDEALDQLERELAAGRLPLYTPGFSRLWTDSKNGAIMGRKEP